MSIHSNIGTETLHKSDTIFAGGDTYDFRTSLLGELNGESADAARRAVNHDVLSGLYVQVIADSLKRRKPCRRDSPGMLEVERGNGGVRDTTHFYGSVLSVKAAFGIIPTVGMHAITNLEPANIRTQLGDCAGPIRTEDEREMDATVRRPTIANVSVPSAHARGMHRDQDFSRAWLRYRKIVEGEHLGAAVSIECDGAHDSWDARLLRPWGALSLGSHYFSASVQTCLHFFPSPGRQCLWHLFTQIDENVHMPAKSLILNGLACW
jgi:hypothetical protein